MGRCGPVCALAAWEGVVQCCAWEGVAQCCARAAVEGVVCMVNCSCTCLQLTWCPIHGGPGTIKLLAHVQANSWTWYKLLAHVRAFFDLVQTARTCAGFL